MEDVLPESGRPAELCPKTERPMGYRQPFLLPTYDAIVHDLRAGGKPVKKR